MKKGYISRIALYCRNIPAMVTIGAVLFVIYTSLFIIYTRVYNHPEVSSSISKEDTVKTTLPYLNNSLYELSLVQADISMYSYLSKSVQEKILSAIDSANRRFEVPIGLIHAITRTESEYRFWINHPTVSIKIKGKLVTTHAIGMGGVIWEIWGDTLRYYGVAYNRSDLYLPDTGIMAEACVLHLIIEDILKSHPSKAGIISKIQANYFGIYSRSYVERMKLVTSDLWLKRMATEIENVYIITEIKKENNVKTRKDSL